MNRLFLVVLKTTKTNAFRSFSFTEYDTAWDCYIEMRECDDVEWAEFLGSTDREGMMRLGFFVPARLGKVRLYIYSQSGREILVVSAESLLDANAEFEAKFGKRPDSSYTLKVE